MITRKTKFAIFMMLIFSICAQAQVKPKKQVKTANKQKVTKSITQIKDTLKDARDGKTYKTVKIGSQIWMAENLAYKDSSGYWAYDGDTTNVAKYGYLYDWETANKVCPTGWHLPSDAEWTKLTTYLGGEEKAGIKMKSTSGWNDFKGKTGNGTNNSGFAGLPGGQNDQDGDYVNIGCNGFWWSSTEGGAVYAWPRYLSYYDDYVIRSIYKKKSRFSVRCLRDL